MRLPILFAGRGFSFAGGRRRTRAGHSDVFYWVFLIVIEDHQDGHIFGWFGFAVFDKAHKDWVARQLSVKNGVRFGRLYDIVMADNPTHVLLYGDQGPFGGRDREYLFDHAK